MGGIGGMGEPAVEKIPVTRTGSLVDAGVGGISGIDGPAVERIPVTRTGSVYTRTTTNFTNDNSTSWCGGTQGEHVVGTGVDGTGGVVDPAVERIHVPVSVSGSLHNLSRGHQLSSLMMTQHLPPLPVFSGEKMEEESSAELLEQFEMMAVAYQWDEPAKLINNYLVTRLKGQAYSFYRSCDTNQRTQYAILVGSLQKRFTPVRIQSVRSSLFHDRNQNFSETVDSYAQDLKRLLF